jgi:hypothetical protein
MPIFNIAVTTEGPVVDLLVGVSIPRQNALRNAGLPVPSAIPIRAIVDTGASTTCIENHLIAPLGMAPTGTIHVHTPSTSGAPLQCDQYDVCLILPHPIYNGTIQIVPIIGCGILGGSIQGLLGRDVLAFCNFFYSGLDARFSLSF